MPKGRKYQSKKKMVRRRRKMRTKEGFKTLNPQSARGRRSIFPLAGVHDIKRVLNPDGTSYSDPSFFQKAATPRDYYHTGRRWY